MSAIPTYPARRGNLATRYAGLVRSIARKVLASLPPDHDVELGDLEQHGHIGLLEAAARWDETQGVKFSTFAFLRIRGEIYNAMRRNEPLGWRVAQRHRELVRTRSMLEQLLGRTPTPAETAEALGLTTVELAELERAHWQGIRALSLQAPIGGGEEGALTIADTLESSAMDPSLIYDRIEAAADAWRRMASLSERERRVIILNVIEGVSCREIGEREGVSAKRVHQIKQRALARMLADEPSATHSEQA